MPKKIFLFPYDKYSKGARSLAVALGAKMIRHDNSKFQPSADKMVINWGSNKEGIRHISAEGRSIVVNTPGAVALCANKKRFFAAVNEGARVPDFTEDYAVAQHWMNNVLEGRVVVGRLTLNGKGGQGIVLSDDDENDNLRKCKLFTTYIPKLKEFRVHVVDGKVVDVQQKKLREEDLNGNPVDKDRVNWRIRSFNNGFIFARNDINVPEDVTTQAVLAFNQIKGLTFGAFDVVYNQKQKKAYVLECNTAPGIEGTTLDNYVEVFKKMAV